jgi:hypothetical protein
VSPIASSSGHCSSTTPPWKTRPLLRRESQEQPLLLVCEGLDWIDTDLLPTVTTDGWEPETIDSYRITS